MRRRPGPACERPAQRSARWGIQPGAFPCRAGRHKGERRKGFAAMAWADDVFRLSHHHATGRPLHSLRVLSLGLAAALLGELVDAHLIDVWDYVQVMSSGQPPADAVTRTVLGVLAEQREPLLTRDWLAYFADRAHVRVAGRMITGGRVERRRTLLLGRAVYHPTDMNTAAGPEALLAYKLRGLTCGVRWIGSEVHCGHQLWRTAGRGRQ